MSKIIAPLVILIALQVVSCIVDMNFRPLSLSINSTAKVITQEKVDELFQQEVEKIVKQGPDNRFWNSVVFNLLAPKSHVQEHKSNKTVFRPNVKQVFDFKFQKSMQKPKRQIDFGSLTDVQTSMIPQSPLGLQSKVQLASQSSDASRSIDASATIALQVSKNLADKVPFESLANFQAPSQFCPFTAARSCDPNDKFRTLDGSCNNLRFPWFGKGDTPFKRYLKPAYDDQLDAPRSKGRLGGPLPNPRSISRALFTDNFQVDGVFSHIVATFGQFLSHDLTSAAASSDSFGKIVDCPCNNGNPACMSVTMPTDENIMRMSCMRFTRSSSAFATFDCRLGHREQLNLLSSFIDLTQVYGTNDARSRELRSFFGGQLKTSPGVNARPYLPQGQDGSCRNTDQRVKCFSGGEGRVNENLALTGMHVLFLREHNRVASELQRINPTWDDNRLFNEARRIVIGEYQNIVFDEWLPVVIGWNTAAVFDLIPLSSNSFYNGYSDTVNPGLAGEFATAAFRFGHTLVRTKIGRFDSNNQQSSPALDLFDIIFRPTEAYNNQAGGIDSIFVGLLNEPASKFDPNIANAMQNRLFEFQLSDGSVIAIDLAATNINRGRDHGIPGYNSFRERCGFKRATTFQDLADLIPSDRINTLSSLYKHVDDIDFYVGGLCERPASGAIVGPTFACIIANQFKDLKKGDRFYYENGPGPTAFSLDQLQELKKATFSRLVCDNYDINTIQPNGFMQALPSINNNRISCSWLQRVDLSKWRQ